jgi:hypothetical protein
VLQHRVKCCLLGDAQLIEWYYMLGRELFADLLEMLPRSFDVNFVSLK